MYVIYFRLIFENLFNILCLFIIFTNKNFGFDENHNKKNDLNERDDNERVILVLLREEFFSDPNEIFSSLIFKGILTTYILMYVVLIIFK
jgi:hypothetical protein